MLHLKRRTLRFIILAFNAICVFFIVKIWLYRRSTGGSRLNETDSFSESDFWSSLPGVIPDKSTSYSSPFDDSRLNILFAVDSPRNAAQRRSVMRSTWISHLKQVHKDATAFFVLPAPSEDKSNPVLKNEEIINGDMYCVPSSYSSEDIAPSTVEFLKHYFYDKCEGTHCEFNWLCKVHSQSYVSVQPLIDNILKRSHSRLQRALVADILPYGHYRVPLKHSRPSIDDQFFCITAELLRDIFVNVEHDDDKKSISSLEDLISPKQGTFTLYNPGSILEDGGSVITEGKNSVSRYTGPHSIIVYGITDDSQYLSVASKFDASGWIGPTEDISLNSMENHIIEGTEDIFLLLKTGASAIWHRLPLHFSSTFKSIRTFQVYSDVADTILDVPVIDAFANMSEELAVSDSMKLAQTYRSMHKERQNLDAALLDVAKESWQLDRFKVAFSLYHAWKTDPTKSWYILIDDDSYVFWANLVPWLRELNPNDKLLLGNKVNVFAHGGSGSVISRALMHEIFDIDKDTWLRDWEYYSKKDCCGDRAFGIMVSEKYNLEVNKYNGENGMREREYPFVYSRFQKEDRDFVRIGKDNFCSPVGTLHHIMVSQLSELRRFERLYGSDPMRHPLIYGNLYEFYLLPFISSLPRRNWDNMPLADTDWTLSDEVDNLAQCQLICEYDEDCFQYQLIWYKEDGPLARPKCVRAAFFTLGRKLGHEELDERTSIAGWFTDRIERARKSVDCQELLGVNAPFNPKDLSEGWFFSSAWELGMSEEEFEKEKERVNGIMW